MARILLLTLLGISQIFGQFIPVDYVVIGAGNGGSTVAGRLAETGRSVLLVEKGNLPLDFLGQLEKMSPRLAFNQWERNDASDRYQSEQDPSGNRYDILHGKGLGGTTLINGNLYTRPDFSEYESWNLPGWTEADIQPFFTKLEDYPIADPKHGTSGPVRISPPKPLTPTSTITSILGDLGFTYEADGNTGHVLPMTVQNPPITLTAQNARLDAFSAYVLPLIQGPGSSLTILPNTQAIGFEYATIEGKKVVTAVNLLMSGKKKMKAVVNREVVISAGVFGTPKVLNLAGIGKTSDLQALDIETELDLPAVGENLIARPMFVVGFSGTTLLPEQNLTKMADQEEIGKFFNGMDSFFNYPISGVWAYGTRGTTADYIMEYSSVSPNFASPIPTAQSIACLVTNVKSRGSVKLRSKDAEDHMRVYPNLLSHNDELMDLLACVQKAREVASVPLGQATLGVEFLPGAAITGELLASNIQLNSAFSYHAFGTASMGEDPATSVVDSRLKVHGIDNLRIADASVIPTSLSSGVISSVYMIGERAAAFILEDDRTPIDILSGFAPCFGDSSLIIKTPFPPSAASEICGSLSLKPLKVLDPELTCPIKKVFTDLQNCGVTAAAVRTRGIGCEALDLNSNALVEVSCIDPMPLICAP